MTHFGRESFLFPWGKAHIRVVKIPIMRRVRRWRKIAAIDAGV
jgi:hypothetical protein